MILRYGQINAYDLQRNYVEENIFNPSKRTVQQKSIFDWFKIKENAETVIYTDYDSLEKFILAAMETERVQKQDEWFLKVSQANVLTDYIKLINERKNKLQLGFQTVYDMANKSFFEEKQSGKTYQKL